MTEKEIKKHRHGIRLRAAERIAEVMRKHGGYLRGEEPNATPHRRGHFSDRYHGSVVHDGVFVNIYACQGREAGKIRVWARKAHGERIHSADYESEQVMHVLTETDKIEACLDAALVLFGDCR
jgi:hypothetical protein